MTDPSCATGETWRHMLARGSRDVDRSSCHRALRVELPSRKYLMSEYETYPLYV